jgi:hypothetical protein
VRAGLGLPDSAHCFLSLDAMEKRLGLLTQTLGLLREALFERGDLLETASLLQGAAPYLRSRERCWRSHHRYMPGVPG